jgi:hypothetical protein
MSCFSALRRSPTAVLGVTLAALGCGSEKKSEESPAATCPAPALPRAPSADEARQTGRIIRALSGKAPIGCATVTVAGETTTTAQDGTYAIVVPKNKPYTMSVAADNHFALREQEWTISTDPFARGDTNMLDRKTAELVSAFLEKRDPTKGTLAVTVIALAPCASANGATLQLDPPGSARLSYFADGLPSTGATAVREGEAFSGAFYNVETNTPVNVKVSSPTCSPVAFPVEYQGVTYSGAQQTQSGEHLAFVRVFIR